MASVDIGWHSFSHPLNKGRFRSSVGSSYVQVILYSHFIIILQESTSLISTYTLYENHYNRMLNQRFAQKEPAKEQRVRISRIEQ